METREVYYDLLTEINDVRNAMLSVGMSKGLDHTETLKYSQELDKLIFKYQSKYKKTSHNIFKLSIDKR
ncbi:aspartyl-phosphate phosphatase Spo0E family protein [Bacillus thermotolerans]|uniref:aspartyl-phosphate phosphatase Spo0E family protein n=1 Tax=Bacillus thermotolerans TaxID=1221996 RepID=UPI00057D581D|nr:aspartyl-phosphate phosphatase Spo0E family protein [Bacillus thermotolerans]